MTPELAEWVMGERILTALAGHSWEDPDLHVLPRQEWVCDFTCDGRYDVHLLLVDPGNGDWINVIVRVEDHAAPKDAFGNGPLTHREEIALTLDAAKTRAFDLAFRCIAELKRRTT